MYLTIKQQLNHLSKNDYLSIRELSHIAKNLANEAIYNARQYFFEYGGNIGYQENYKLLKKSKVVDLEVLYNRGEVDTPVRIRIA